LVRMLVWVLIVPILVAADVPPAPVGPDQAGVIGASEGRSEEECVPAVEAVESVVDEGVPWLKLSECLLKRTLAVLRATPSSLLV
jgi:hypothetical protein